LSNAILVNRGNATKTIFVFADPLCKHCQDLEKYLSDYPTLTIYAYLVPNDQVNRGATSIAKAMWCSPDKSRAYVDYMVRGILPANAGGDCPTPFAENQRIMSAINIIKTPGIVFGDGYRIEGTPTPTQLKTLIQNTPR
jgi:thiol:disulfide interchange protein DsbC